MRHGRGLLWRCGRFGPGFEHGGGFVEFPVFTNRKAALSRIIFVPQASGQQQRRSKQEKRKPAGHGRVLSCVTCVGQRKRAAPCGTTLSLSLQKKKNLLLHFFRGLLGSVASGVNGRSSSVLGSVASLGSSVTSGVSSVLGFTSSSLGSVASGVSGGSGSVASSVGGGSSSVASSVGGVGSSVYSLISSGVSGCSSSVGVSSSFFSSRLRASSERSSENERKSNGLFHLGTPLSNREIVAGSGVERAEAASPRPAGRSLPTRESTCNHTFFPIHRIFANLCQKCDQPKEICAFCAIDHI